MKCKHENADHLKPGDRVMWDGPLDGYVAQCEQFRCIDCDAWLSLGPANDDDPRVAVEIRAAEIAADWGTVTPLCDDDVLENNCAVCGWYAHLGNVDQATAEWHAGYLARCIATHSEDA